MNLRNEEKYYIAIKKSSGNEVAAKEIYEKSINVNRNRVKSLIDQMNEVVCRNIDVSSSQKKTAISFISQDINNGFTKFISEKKEQFPTTISLKRDGFVRKTTDGSNKDTIIAQYKDYMDEQMNKAIEEAKASNKSRTFLIWALIMLGAGVLMLISPDIRVLGIISAIVGACLLIASSKAKKNTEQKIYEIIANYNSIYNDGSAKLDRAIIQWKALKKKVDEFDDSNLKAIS